MEKGQASPELVVGIIVVLAIAAFGGLIFGSIQMTAEEQAEGQGRTLATDQLLNVTFADNTLTLPDNWDNAVENAAANAYNTSLEYVTTNVTDNGDVDGDGTGTTENGWWFQSLTVSSLRDGLTSATVTASYRLIDNENLEAINSYIYLDDGTENTQVWTDNTIDNAATWTSISVDVSDNVDATGTYTLYLYTEILPDNDQVGSNIQVAWTAANLTVVTHNFGLAENIVGAVGQTGGDTFPLVMLVILLGAFGAILAVLKMWG